MVTVSSHSLQTHPVIQHTSAFWIEREGNGPSGSIQHSEESWELTHMLPLPQRDTLWAEQASWHLNCAALGENDKSKKPFFLFFSAQSLRIIYCCYSIDVWNFSADSQASTKTHSSMEDCQNWCSWGKGGGTLLPAILMTLLSNKA